MANPDSIEAWKTLAQRHEVVARLVATNKVGAGESLLHVGLAVEALLKAYIMKKERLNSWPSKDARPDLYTHDLRALVKIAEIELGQRDAYAPAWALVLQWDRNQGYDPKPMPRRVAAEWVEAAFGESGAATWLRQSLAR